MKIFAKILSNFTIKHIKDCYIYYKIVNYIEENQDVILQCINKKTIFHAKIAEIVFDTDILYGLHPIQACYIGIEYSKIIKNLNSISPSKSFRTQKFNEYFVHRYGKYRLIYQNRQGGVCFIDEFSNETFLMDPRDIALSDELIQEFDAAQAFYIGFLVGLKINKPMPSYSVENKKYEKPTLRFVK